MNTIEAMTPPYTPDELRALAKETGPLWDGAVRGALVYAANVMESAAAVIKENAKLVPMTNPEVDACFDGTIDGYGKSRYDIARAVEAHHSRQAAPSQEPTDAELFTALQSVDPEAKRLPPGFRDFARAVLALK